ncbi:SDR family oxidoreductase [Sphingobacterium sp.]|uniref:NAD-dependent epimerase/dehydratase family protein n=1 Tax=Sphingobacterium sp. TaxID=341027 RepID=UPI00289DECD3|nr:SDR family oxidoreductase [Sphingobacterium sp.]
MNTEKLKIVIIGSKGFIGSNALSYFENLGHDVYGCGVSEYPLDEKYFQVDRFAPDYNNIFKLEKFDVCINASGSPGVGFSLEYPQEDFRMNVSNVYSLLNAIRVYNKDCKFINLSSAAVYGNPKELPIKEDSKLNPLSPYGFHKMITEQLISEFFQVFGISTVSFRIFSAYGPGIKKQLLWDIYQKSISANNKGEVALFGKGNETRDFIYVEDLMEALNIAIQNDLFKGKTYNLGSGVETSIEDIASTFLNIINPSLQLNFNGIQKPGDPLFWCSDMSELEKYGFKVKITIQEGLKNYHNWLINETNEK